MQKTPAFPTKILRLDTIDSTNTALKKLAASGEAEEGTVLVAKAQTEGRGRGDHTWHSPKGGLYYSVLLKPLANRQVTDLNFLVSAAVAQAVRELLPKAIETSLKWPNDILLNGKKGAGILGETVTADPGSLAVVGVGLNVNATSEDLAPFRERYFSATSFADLAPGGEFDLEEIISVLNRKLSNLYTVYREQGFQPIQYLWERNCQLVGKRIEIAGAAWRKGSETHSSETPIRGTVLGIDESGALVLTNDQGERRHCFAGEIVCYLP